MQLQEFHKSLLTEFEPLVVSYLDYLDKKMSEDLVNNFQQETWMPVMLVYNVCTVATWRERGSSFWWNWLPLWVH